VSVLDQCSGGRLVHLRKPDLHAMRHAAAGNGLPLHTGRKVGSSWRCGLAVVVVDGESCTSLVLNSVQKLLARIENMIFESCAYDGRRIRATAHGQS
jgi:hypothetical protein